MITIALQAGGKSTRMGKDKALVPFLGVPLISRLKNRFLNIGEELVVITNDFSGYQDLHVPLYKDLIPDRGALGGLYTALAVTTTPILWLIAVDLPFADPELMAYISKVLETTGADAVLPSTEDGIEPLHAVYQVETCLPFVKNALDQDLWKMTSWYDQAKIQILTPAETRDNTTSEHTFWNLNTPEDFRRAEREALKLNLV